MNEPTTTQSVAQFIALLFLIVGAGGLLTGDASHVTRGHAAGNVDGVALHLTYVRDALNLIVCAALAYAGWPARERDAAFIVLAVGGLMLALAVIGFVVNDTDSGGRSVIGLHFPLAINVLDCVPDPRALLAECTRVVRGDLVLATPYDWSANATPFAAWLGGHSQRGDDAGACEPGRPPVPRDARRCAWRRRRRAPSFPRHAAGRACARPSAARCRGRSACPPRCRG